MKINIVVPDWGRTTFSGGMWCVLEYAAGLTELGHKVTVIPVTRVGHQLEWFNRKFGELVVTPRSARLKLVLKRLAAYLKPSSDKPSSRQERLRDLAGATSVLLRHLLPYELWAGVDLYYLERVMPAAEVTIATAAGTALPVALVGMGRLYYFMQHFETIMAQDSPHPALAERGTYLTYRLGLRMIANSSWLKSKVEAEFPGTHVELCPNAIDHKVFCGAPKVAELGKEVRIISSSGGCRAWKGFIDMAEAVRIVRNRLPDRHVRWSVYGPNAPLPPHNSVAAYEALGFLQPRLLAEAYRSADILLSASWAESFPLFALEAMASGLPVITTQSGTEDYAIPGMTAEVVEPRNPASVAEGLIHVITDPEYRHRIAIGGNEIAKDFTWGKSVTTFERILLTDATEKSHRDVGRRPFVEQRNEFAETRKN
jgi:glycosyltransferase involved in cell wall biosynthesis